MKKIMVVVAVLIAHGLFAQEIDVQELFKKIEQRNSALKNLKAQGFIILTAPYRNPNNIFVVDTTYLKDEFLSFDVLMKTLRTGSAMINYIYLKDGWAFKFTSPNYTYWGMQPPSKISLVGKGQETYLDNKFFLVLTYLLFASSFDLYAYSMMLDINLVPSKIFKGKQLKVRKIRENGKEYALIEDTIPFSRYNYSTQFAYYLNLKELVFEKITITWSFRQEPQFITKVEKFDNINNVPLPQLVTIRGESDCIVAKIIFKSFQTNLDKIDKPYWLSDTNLPDITKETSQELGSKIEKDPQNIKLLLQYLTTKFLEIHKFLATAAGVTNEWFDVFSEEYESILSELKESNTDSLLVNEMELVSLIGEEELGECEEKLKQINYSNPHVIYLLALRLAERKKDPSRLLEKIGQDSIIKEAILSEYKISQIKTFQELQDILEGKTFEEKWVLCDRIGSARTSSVLSKRLVEEMEKKAEDDFVKLLLARYFVRKKKNEKAAQYYVQLSDELFNLVRLEIENLAKKGAPAELMQRVIKTTKDVELLIQYALDNIKSKEIDAIVKRVIESIQVARRYASHVSEQPMNLIEKLLDEGKNELLKQLLPVVVKYSPSVFWIGEEEMTDIIRKVTNNNKEEIYEIVKHNLERYPLHMFAISDEEVKDIIIKKVKEDKADEADFMMFVKKMKQWKLQDVLNTLEKAYEKCPSNIKIQEALADQYTELQQYEKAIKLYRSVLSGVTGGSNSDRHILVKFAFVAGKLYGESAVKEIAKYEERYHPYVVAQAYEVLGKHDIAWEKCKKYTLTRIRLSTLDGSELEILSNFAKKAGKELETYMICEVFFDEKLIKRRLQKWIKEIVTKAKENLKISQQHFIDYILQQPCGDVGQDDKQRAETLIKQLNSDSLEERNQATQELIKMGKKIVPLLKEHLDLHSLEVQVRVRNVLYRIGYDELKQQILQQ